MHFLRESKRQTLTQQTQEPGTATGGINNAGKIVTAIFVPIIGLIIIGCFYWVCLSDKVVEHFAKRKDIHTARREARMAKRGARNEGTVNGIEMQDRQRVWFTEVGSWLLGDYLSGLSFSRKAFHLHQNNSSISNDTSTSAILLHITDSIILRRADHNEGSLQHNPHLYPTLNPSYLKQRIFTSYLHVIDITSLRQAFQLQSRCQFITSKDTQTPKQRHRPINASTRECSECSCRRICNFFTDAVGLRGFGSRSNIFLCGE